LSINAVHLDLTVYLAAILAVLFLLTDCFPLQEHRYGFGVRSTPATLARGEEIDLQQVADAVGCTKAYIWELEMKDGQRPSAERIQKIAKVLGVTMEDVMGEPMQQVPQASPEDVAFFREYAGMTDEEKDRYRQALKIMFPDKSEGGD
jgi:transcriptional regulator with XRE-family HTH domain